MASLKEENVEEIEKHDKWWNSKAIEIKQKLISNLPYQGYNYHSLSVIV